MQTKACTNVTKVEDHTKDALWLPNKYVSPVLNGNKYWENSYICFKVTKTQPCYTDQTITVLINRVKIFPQNMF